MLNDHLSKTLDVREKDQLNNTAKNTFLEHLSTDNICACQAKLDFQLGSRPPGQKGL